MPLNDYIFIQIFRDNYNFIITYIKKMEFFQQSLMAQMIRNYQFKKSQRFNKDPACMTYMIEFIQKQITHINSTNLCLIEKLIQQYKFPILICFQSVYKTTDDTQICMYKDEFINILLLVRKLTLQIDFQELQFYSFQGKIKSSQIIKNKIPRNFTECDKNFLKYAHKISQVVSQMEKLYKMTKQGNERRGTTMMRLDNVQSQTIRLGKQLQMSINQTNFKYQGLMVLQNNYIKLMKQKFQHYENKILGNLDEISNEYSRFDCLEIEDYQERKPTQNQYEDIKYYQYCRKSQSNFQYLFSQKQIQACNQYSQSSQTVTNHHDQGNFELKLPLCCKQFFDYGQYILQGDFMSTSCINVKFEQMYDKQTSRIIKQQICSLVNTKGGVALIGINRNLVNNIQFIQGLTITQYQKQVVCIYLDELIKQIQPVVSMESYSIDFVPVNREVETYTKFACEPSGIRYQQSLYVIRIRINYGNRNQIYSFKHDHKDFFFRRNKQGALQLKIRDVLQIAKKLLVKPFKTPRPVHQGKCRSPLRRHPTDVKIQKPTNYNEVRKADEGFIIENKGFKKNKKSKNGQKVPLPYQLSVFGVAYDYLIWGLTGKQVWKIFYWKNIDKMVAIKEVDQNITYVRNLYVQNIKSIKLAIKSINEYLGEGHKRVRVTAISKNIIINQFQIDEVYEVLIDLGFRFYSYEHSKHIVRFEQTYDAGIAFIELTKLDINCQFVVNQ